MLTIPNNPPSQSSKSPLPLMQRRQFIAVDWGSTNFRAHLLSSRGEILDEINEPAGVTRLDRTGMADAAMQLRSRWPEPRYVICSGMIGSNVGWITAPYVECPVSVEDLGHALIETRIGEVSCQIVPGLACRGGDGEPDIMRGEEVEIAGAIACYPELKIGEAILVLPGTHTKWVRLFDGVVQSFFTSMSGEVFDRLSERGLLSSVISGDAVEGEAFDKGARRGAEAGAGLGRLLFSVRAQSVRDSISTDDAASQARGALIGAEIVDALSLFPRLQRQTRTILTGNQALCNLYARAMKHQAIRPEIADKRAVTAAGYLAIARNTLGIPHG